VHLVAVPDLRDDVVEAEPRGGFLVGQDGRDRIARWWREVTVSDDLFDGLVAVECSRYRGFDRNPRRVTVASTVLRPVGTAGKP